MRLIDEGKPSSPNIMSVDAGEVFVGGRYHSLVPILKEEYSVSGQVREENLEAVCVESDLISFRIR